MSSYQQRYLTGHLYKESPPDYLTCGHCAKEFVLDNITLFIAHKAGGCDDWAQSKGSPSGFSGYDTSSPLTCSSCSRVFMTARGLLQHVQQDHQMSICLQKGPLFIDGDSAPAEGDTGSARPPPAHASINSRDYMTTDKQKSPCPTASSAATACCDHSDQSDQPTDLSMTCSNGLGKAVVKCNDHGCKITLEPKKNVRDAPAPSEVTDANKAATLPKKRRFLTATDNEFTSNSGNPSNPNNANDVMQAIPSNASDVTKNVNIIESGEMTNALEDIAEGDDDSVFYQRTTNVEESKEAESASNVSVYVTAQYAKDELCCVSLSTQKEKNAKLKKLLETEPPADSKALESVVADADSQCADKSTTKLVYKFPFLVPKSPDSVKPLLAVTEGSADGGGSRSVARGSDSSPHLPPAGDSYGQASRGPGLGFVPGSTLEQNIDRIIRASISSDAYPEEFDILRMETDTPGSLKSGSDSSRSPPTGHPSMARSPRLVTPTQQYRRMSQSSVDYDMPMLINAVKSSDIYDSPIYKLKPPPPVTPGDLSNKMSPVPVATFLPPGLSPHPSMDDQVGLHRQKDVPHLDSASPPGGLRRYNNSLARPEPPTFMPVDGANPGHSDRHFLQGHYATGTQGSVERAVGLDKAFRKGFGHPRVGVLDPGLPSLTSVQQQHQALYRDVADSQWLGLQEDNSSNGEFHGAVGRSGMDPLDMMAGSDLSALDLEDKGYEGKAMKKRRYPTSRPFKCDHCDQAFNQRIHLKKHMSKHTGV
ncbi:uncharacterized protein LOC106012521, partial [Aplysia californica]|uniref:Uncharacterized protein LOC106012521 n=1 Tax=Aplysia californica TaxID=6500 RepID=A0ABM1A5C5_APLCA